MKPYYYVYRYKHAGPIVRHATLASAQAEAERLATQHPGDSIEILKAVGISRINGPASTFFMDGEGAAFDDMREYLNNIAKDIKEFSNP